MIEPAIHRLGQKVPGTQSIYVVINIPALYRGASKFYGTLDKLRDKLFFFNVSPHQIKEIEMKSPVGKYVVFIHPLEEPS